MDAGEGLRTVVVSLFFASVFLFSLPGEGFAGALATASDLAGYALDFDGGDHASAAAHPALDFAESNQFTLEAWVYRRPEGAYWQVVLGKQHTNPYGLTVSADRLLRFELTTSTGTRRPNTPAGSVPFNTWTHIAGTWDGSIMRAYVNGVERAFRLLDGTIQKTAGPFLIGAADTGASEACRGIIDEVRIWNLARSASEILDASAIPLNGNEAGLVAYWRFDEGSGEQALDSGPTDIRLGLGTSAAPDMSDPAWVLSGAPLVLPERGTIQFRRRAHACSGTCSVRLLDAGLVGQATWTVPISTTRGDLELPTLVESAEQPGRYEGILPLGGGIPARMDGVLQVEHGNILSATYEDADDGSGNPAIATATAAVDCVPPVISNLHITGIAQLRAAVQFETDESTTPLVRYGTDCQSLGMSISADTTETQHELRLTGLLPNTTHFVSVEATDAAGNRTTDDNAGACYSFTTASHPRPPFVEDFESGDLGYPWIVTGTNNFRTRVTSELQPYSGVYHLVMDSTGGYARNEATLTLGLDGCKDVILRFRAKEFNDEAHGPPPSPFIDGANFDGVAVSQDGVSWYEVCGLRDLSGSYNLREVDLDAAIQQHGLAYNASFRIRFNQYDDYSATTDGIAIDDIEITGRDLRRGEIAFDREAYTCAGSVGVDLTDLDLIGSGTITVPLRATGGDTESLALHEIPGTDGEFTAVVPIETGEVFPEDGILQVSHGETISATYEDADDGTGDPAIAQATAEIDCVAPMTTNVAATEAGCDRATVVIETTEPTTTLVRYGTDCQSLGMSVSANITETRHEFRLSGLQPTTTYFLTIEVTDAAGNRTVDDNGGACYSFTVPACPRPPLAENFESGELSSLWVVTGTNNFRTRVTSELQPYSGVYHLVMDSTGGYARNEVTLTLDLEGFKDVIPRFWAKEFGDEAHGPPPSPFVDGANFDGVAVSQDGVNWYEVCGLRDLSGSYNLREVDLDAAIQQHGLAYNPSFRIRFNQYDDSSATSDGIAIDDIEITGRDLKRGEIAFDREVYNCTGSVGVHLTDFHLIGSGTVTVPLGTTGGDTESLALHEISGTDGEFTAVLPIETGEAFPEDGVLQVFHGETISATYADADDGSGNPAIATATASVDCVPPVISGLLAGDLEPLSAVIFFHTDEPCKARIWFGTDCAWPGGTAGVAEPTLDFEIPLTNLVPETEYFFTVTAVDIAGNSTIDDNNGLCHSFTTPGYPSPPFFDGFESGGFGDPWTVSGTRDFRARVLSDYEPHRGSYHAALDDSRSDSTYSRTELTLTLNLEGCEEVTLNYWAKEFDDEPHGPPPSPHEVGADYDGVAVSEDGTIWYEIRNLRTLASEYRGYEIDLDAAVESFGLRYNRAFRIRFSQYDDDPITTDGIAIDDVLVTASKVDDLAVSPRKGLILRGPAGEWFTPSFESYSLTNSGSAELEWAAGSSVDWLDVSPLGGVLVPAVTERLFVAANETAFRLASETYFGMVTISNLTSGISRTRRVTLVATFGGDGCFFFSGDDFVESEETPLLDLAENNQLTIEAAIHRRGTGEWTQVILGKEGRRSYSMWVNGDGIASFKLETSSGSRTISTSSGTVPLDTWVLIAGTWDGTTMRVYINSEEKASGTLGGTLTTTPGGILIGAAQRDGQYGWIGMIDEVRVWNVVRSATDMEATWDSFPTGTEEGLVAYWNMDEGFGQWSYDSTDNGIRLRLGTSEETETRDPIWVRVILPRIAPEEPTTVDDLTCVVRPDPWEIPDIDLSHRWFRDAQEITEPLEFDSQLFFATGPVLSHFFTVKNETYFCTLDIEGDYPVEDVNTLPVKILNSLPTAPAISIFPRNPQPEDGLSIIISQLSTDSDEDEIDYAIRWYRSLDGGQTFTFLPFLSGILPTGMWVPPGYLVEGDIWRAEMVAFEVETADVEGEAGWDQVYVGVNEAPLVTIERPGAEDEVAFPFATLRWSAEDPDGDSVKVDLYYDPDQVEGGGSLIARDLPAEGMLIWSPPEFDVPRSKADLSGDGVISVEDLFLFASMWQAEVEGKRYWIFARAWDEKGAIGEAFSPGQVIVPDEFPGNAEGLLYFAQAWSKR